MCTLTNSSGEVVWTDTDSNCSWNPTTVCLPFDDYTACVEPEFTGNGGEFSINYVPELGYNIWVAGIMGWNDTAES